MNRTFFKNKEIKAVISLLIILLSLFIIAFVKITARRFSYALYQSHIAFDRSQDEYYSNLKVYKKMTQTQKLDKLAKKHSLDKKQAGQIIQVIDGQATVID